MADLSAPASKVVVDTFKKSIDDMIATNDKAYKSIQYANQRERVRHYTSDDAKRIVTNGSLLEKQELSQAFFRIDGFYRRIIIYYATLLKYQGVLVPHTSYGHKLKDGTNEKRYSIALDFIERCNIPTLCTDFALKALINGTYYGVIQTLDKNNFTILDLPSKYCSSRYKDIFNNDLIEFDLTYFNTLEEGYQRDSALSVYPKEISKAYRKMLRGGPKYYKIPSSIGICFPMYDGVPLLLPSIPKSLNYDEYEDLEKKKDTNEVRRILVQKIPHLNDGQLVFQPIEAEEMHRGAVSMMQSNENVSVLTTYADVSVESASAESQSAKYNNLDKIVQTVYRSAGASAELFAATGNMALSTSIDNDTALMMNFANKISRFITNITNYLYGNNTMSFKYTILPITFYNEKEYIDNAYKEASMGYSLILPALAMGITQRDLCDLKSLENDILKLGEKLIPLQTSFNGGSNAGTGQGAGRPALEDKDKSDKTIANEKAKDNGGGS